MEGRFRGVLAVLTAQLAVLAFQPLPAGEPAGPPTSQSQRGLSLSLGIASEYVVHGLARSQGKPVVNGNLGFGLGGGWQVSAHATTMDLNRGPGPSRELGLYLGHRRAVGEDWELGGNIARYEFWRNTSFLPYDYTEATFDATWRSMVRMRVQYSPDYSLFSRRGPAREFETWTSELQFDYPLRPGLALAAAVGHYDLTAGLGQGYYFWTLGGLVSRGRVTLAVNYVGVDHTAKTMFNSRFTGDRIIATLALRAH
jgi:uncharacterized protein (TIGR02001 family)